MTRTYSGAILVNAALNSKTVQDSLLSGDWNFSTFQSATEKPEAAIRAGEENAGDTIEFEDVCGSEGEPCDFLPMAGMEIEGTLHPEEPAEADSQPIIEEYLGRKYRKHPKEYLYYVFEQTAKKEGFTAIEPTEGIDFAYSGFQTLSEKDWIERTPDTITFEGVRYASNEYNSRPIFRETTHILLETGDSLRATALYEDGGKGSTTIVPTTHFPVESSSGRFTGVQLLKFNYFNNYEQTGQNVRTIELLRPLDS